MADHVLDELRQRYDGDAPRYVHLAYRNQPVGPRETVRNIRGEVIEEGTRPGVGLLLLLDPWPYANWAHECWVGLIDARQVGEPDDRLIPCTFPPQEDDASHLVPCAIYDAIGGLRWYYPPERSQD
jgi:hypothetical protein